jgi:hypothetical protein
MNTHRLGELIHDPLLRQSVDVHGTPALLPILDEIKRLLAEIPQPTSRRDLREWPPEQSSDYKRGYGAGHLDGFKEGQKKRGPLPCLMNRAWRYDLEAAPLLEKVLLALRGAVVVAAYRTNGPWLFPAEKEVPIGSLIPYAWAPWPEAPQVKG